MVYQLRLHHGHGVNCIVIGKKVMATEKKDSEGTHKTVMDLHTQQY